MRPEALAEWRKRGYVLSPDGKNLILAPGRPLGASIPHSAVTLPKRNIEETQSPLEAKFMALWIESNGPTLEREVMVCPGRKWRSDFLHEETKTIIEIEGLGPHHQGVPAFRKDAEKYLATTLLGYTVFRLTHHIVTEEVVRKIIALVNNKSLGSRKSKGRHHE